MSSYGEETTGSAQDAHVFSKSIPCQVRLQEIIKALGDADGLKCLEIGGDNGMMSHQLHLRGGDWETVVFGEEEAERIRGTLADKVHVLSGNELPFESKTFDVVVIIDGLEKQASDVDFIEMCHKVMKPESRLIACVTREKHGSPIPVIKRMLGVTPERLGFLHEGYTETHLFHALKHGFDVLQMRSFSRFFLECVDAFVSSATRKAQAAADPARLMRVYSAAHAFYWIAYQLDLLMFLTRGHRLIASAKRRTWRSRKAPILVDGRSISEAVLSAPLK